MSPALAKVAAIKQKAEDLGMQLLENGLVTDDAQLAPACEKLGPFQAKLGQVDRALLQKGLALVEIKDPWAEEEEALAKACLVELVDKLHNMRMVFGIF